MFFAVPDEGYALTVMGATKSAGQYYTISNGTLKDVIPTVLYFKSEDEYIIGKKASSMSSIHPEACVKNFKLYFTDPLKKYKVVAENGDEFVLTEQ